MPQCQVKSSDSVWNDTMAAGIMSAIDSVSSVAWDGSVMSRLEFREKQLLLYRDIEKSLTYVLITSLSAPTEIAEGCLNEMRERFETICYAKMNSTGLTTSGNFHETYSPEGHELLQKWNEQARRRALQTGEPHYQALYAYEEVEQREKTAFILDKTVLRVICDAGSISLSHLRQQIASFENILGERIDLAQIQSICDRYIQEGLIRKL
jgi:hypothetical protein